MAAKKTQVTIRREAQLEQIQVAIEGLERVVDSAPAEKSTLDLLQSVCKGLYEELDKLAKKSPAEQVTPLVFDQVNDVIREAKKLASDDQFMKKYAEFVAAGDYPEHRDVVIVLRQILQGLSRFDEALKIRRKKAEDLLANAKGIDTALQLSLQGNAVVEIDDIEANDERVGQHWKEGPVHYRTFSFSKLDAVDIPKYFSL